MKTLFSFMLALSLASVTWGSDAGRAGDGAGGLRLDDDRVILADPYVKRIGVATDLPNELVYELRRVDRLWRSIGLKICKNCYKVSSDFFANHVFHRHVEYRFVEKVPKCKTGDLENTPEGSEDFALACTNGLTTWLDRGSFTGTRGSGMTVREMAKTIIHERLHAAYKDLSDFLIADITDGLEILLDLYQRQILGERPRVNEEGVSALNTMRRRLDQLGMIYEKFLPYEFLDSGGYMNRRYQTASPYTFYGISKSAYIGVGVTLATRGGATILDEAEIVNSTINQHCSGGQCASLYLNRGAKILGSRIQLHADGSDLMYDYSNEWRLGPMATIVNAVIHSRKVRLEERAKIDSSSIRNVEPDLRKNSYLGYSQVSETSRDWGEHSAFEIDTDTRVKNLRNLHINGIDKYKVFGADEFARLRFAGGSEMDFLTSPICPALNSVFAFRGVLTLNSETGAKDHGGMCGDRYK